MWERRAGKERGAGEGKNKKGSRGEPHGKWAKKRGATRGLPRRSPILVFLSPKHV